MAGFEPVYIERVYGLRLIITGKYKKISRELEEGDAIELRQQEKCRMKYFNW